MEIKNKQDNDHRAAIEAKRKSIEYINHDRDKKYHELDVELAYENGFLGGIAYATQKLAETAGQFDQMPAAIESLNQKNVAGDTGFIRGARWQYEQTLKKLGLK